MRGVQLDGPLELRILWRIYLLLRCKTATAFRSPNPGRNDQDLNQLMLCPDQELPVSIFTEQGSCSLGKRLSFIRSSKLGRAKMALDLEPQECRR